MRRTDIILSRRTCFSRTINLFNVLILQLRSLVMKIKNCKIQKTNKYNFLLKILKGFLLWLLGNPIIHRLLLMTVRFACSILNVNSMHFSFASESKKSNFDKWKASLGGDCRLITITSGRRDRQSLEILRKWWLKRRKEQKRWNYHLRSLRLVVLRWI